MNTKEEKMRITVFNVTFAQMINGIKIRFSQETLDMKKTFDLDAEMIKSVINLLQHTDYVLKGDKKKCTWISW